MEYVKTKQTDLLTQTEEQRSTRSVIQSEVRRRPDEAGQVQHLVCFSHLRWKFVYQRPQHLLARAGRQWHVWFIEEPVYGPEQRLEVTAVSEHVSVVVPHLLYTTNPNEAVRLQRAFVDQLFAQHTIHSFITWYYTPTALAFSDHLKPRLMVYDCMDELSAFHHAPLNLLEQETRLLNRADLVFTGGLSLYEAKQKRHPRVFAFPSSIDRHHFRQARQGLPEPADLVGLPTPRIGFCGVIDERVDVALLDQVAKRRPNWQFVLIGPVVKIDPVSLPQRPNVHYLGMKPYDQLPAYFSHWNVAIMPFAINDATRYISPTKTPEYLAAGLPVVSTPIRDVVRTYGSWPQVLVAGSVSAFEQAIAGALAHPPADWSGIDAYLRENSWDNTWANMQRIIQSQLMVVADQ